MTLYIARLRADTRSMDIDHTAPLRRTLAATLVAAAGLGVAGAFVYMSAGYHGAIVRSLLLSILATAMLLVVLRARRFRAIGHIMAVIYASLVVSTVLERGSATLMLPTIAVLPLLTTFTGGRRDGWAWAGICGAMTVGAFTIEPDPITDETTLAIAVALMTLALTILVAMLASSFAKSQRQARDRMREANVELAERNRLLEEAMAQMEHARADADVAREQALAASHAKSVFLTAMSHEVRTPLNGVVGLAALLADADLSPDEAELVGHIRRAGEHLADLLGDVLDLSALEAGEVPLRVAPFNPREPLRQVVAGFAPLARERGVVLALDLAGDVPTVQGDASRVRQVVSHLVGNALKYTDHGRVVLRLRAHRAEDDTTELHIEVADTGAGVEPEVLERIFEPFRQGSEGLDRAHGGTGLGLALCRSLAQAMGGDLTVRSEPGTGSVFTMRLLLPEVTTLPEDSLPLLTPGLHVAVIEDEPVNRHVIKSMLEKAGCVVHVAVDGAEGLELIRRENLALVLSDVQMPNLDGVEMTRALRTEGIQVPIVAVTANALSSDRVACLEAGMNDVLTKPVHPTSLLGAVNRWTAGADFSEVRLRRLAGVPGRDAS